MKNDAAPSSYAMRQTRHSLGNEVRFGLEIERLKIHKKTAYFSANQIFYYTIHLVITSRETHLTYKWSEYD